MLASCIALLPVLQLSKALTGDQQTLLIFAVVVLVSVAFQPGLIKITAQMTAGMGFSWTDVVCELRKTPIYLIATVLYLCSIAIAGAFLFIPGLVVSALFSFYGFAIVVENTNLIDAFRRSFIIAKSYVPSIIVAQVFMVLLMVGPMLLTGEIAYTLVASMSVFILPYLMFLGVIHGYEREKQAPQKSQPVNL